MDINQEYARRLFLAISKIDGIYYLLGKKSRVKENVLKPVFDVETAAMKKALNLFPIEFIEVIENYARLMNQEKDNL